MEEYRNFFDYYLEHFSIGAVLFFPFYCMGLAVFGFFKRLFCFK